MAELRIPIIAELKGKKAFSEAESSVKSLSKAVKALGIGLSATAVVNFGKQSLKAFIDDELAATRLTKAVDNLGMSFANPYISDYIQKMEQTTKVADDELRPAFQALLQQTGSLAKSQSILNTAIEVSRGSGASLSDVVSDLNNAYIGNTKGLKKYNLGLTAATLKATSFKDIQDLLNQQFAGSNTAYLNTYAGGVNTLSLAWGNLQETTGGALLTMASFGSGDQAKGLSNLAAVLDNIGKSVTLISKGWDSIAGLANFTDMKNGLLAGFNPYRRPSGSKDDKKEEKSIETFADKLKKIEEDRLKQMQEFEKKSAAEARKRAAAEKQALKLKQMSKIFDLDYIQIYAALQGKLSDEERTRVRLQLALLDENVNAAQYLSEKLAESQGKTSMLATFLKNLPDAKNPFAQWGDYLTALELQAKKIASQSFGGNGNGAGGGGGTGGDMGTGGGGTGGSGGGSSSVVTPKTYLDYLGLGEYQINAGGRGDVYVTVNGSVLTNQELTEAIRQGLLSASLSGSSSSTGRIQGSFAI